MTTAVALKRCIESMNTSRTNGDSPLEQMLMQDPDYNQRSPDCWSGSAYRIQSLRFNRSSDLVTSGQSLAISDCNRGAT